MYAVCKKFSDFKSVKSRNIEMAKILTSCRIYGSEEIIKK